MTWQPVVLAIAVVLAVLFVLQHLGWV